MDSSLIGILIGFFLVVYAIVAGGDWRAFYDFKSILIVVGGTVGATIASYPWETLKKVTSVLRALRKHTLMEPREIIEQLVSYAEKARREGLLALEDDVNEMAEPFLQKGFS